jgi:hypothetical protein
VFRKILPGIQNLPVEEIVMSQTTLADLQSDIQPLPMQNIAMSMETVAGFESMQRIAKLFSKSSIAPKAYQGNVADCFIAVDMAMRMGANPLMVMQNLYIVHGSPAWSAQFLIATFNKSGRFSAIRYEFQGVEGKDDWGCRAVTTELATREKLVGPLITIGLAKKEGWHSKPGSKWQTMPEQMLRYRAAAWLVRAYAPEIAMGLHTADELEDRTITVEAVPTGEVLDQSTTTLDAIAEQTTPEEKPKRKAAKKQEAEPSPEETPPAPLQTGDILCPHENSDGSQRIVEISDCETCKDRPGCPAHKKDDDSDVGL